jgi:hypothetical protein
MAVVTELGIKNMFDPKNEGTKAIEMTGCVSAAMQLKLGAHSQG